MREEIRTIENEISSGRLLNYVENVSRHHRVQASQGHRDAANYIQGALARNGVSGRVLSYPYAYGTNYLTRKSFDEWNCDFAELVLVAPERRTLADFTALATSVIQRSAGCDYSNEPLDIVLLDKGSKEESYGDVDLRDKLIFVRDSHTPYVDWAVKKRGALGIITDFVSEDPNARDRQDQYDVSKYSAFWYYDKPEITPFGFSITPREGDNLAKICKKTMAEYEKDHSKDRYPRAVCKINAEFRPGFVEAVEAEIKGETDEEIWIYAHTCHPRTSANDNASGVAAAMEAISVINRLVTEKKIKPLKRTLKVILAPEFSGLMPYLSDHRNGKCLAAINMDMVGGKQELGYGPLTVVGLPCSTPSFVGDLAGFILDELKKDVVTHSPDTYLPMFNSEKVTYSGGSDHLILTDPVIGIPCPMLLQWPDVFYHTGGDTLDKISPRLISKSASLTAAYAHKLCTLELEDIKPILGESFKSFIKANIDALARYNSETELSPGKALDIILEFYRESANDFKRFFKENNDIKNASSGPDELINNHNDLLKTTSEGLRKAYAVNASESRGQKHPQVPVRLTEAVVIGVADRAETESQKAMLKDYTENWAGKHGHQTVAQYVTQYLIDGKRTIDEIADLAMYESKGNCKEAIVRFIYLYRELGFCKF